MKSEPVVVVGLVQAVVMALLTLVTAFGVDLTDAQTSAVLGLTAAVLAVGSALFARRKVTPTGE